MTSFKIGLHMDDILYLGYNLLLTLLLAVFKDPIAIIFIQVIVAGLSVILVYNIARMLFNRVTAVIASYFYAYSWDITLWSTYILSDSFFITLLLLSIYCLLKAIDTKKKKYTVLFVLISVLMLVFRPAGIMSVAFIMLYIAIIHRKTMTAFIVKYRLAIGGVVTAAVVACIFLFLNHKLDPLIESMQFNAKKVLYNIYANGWIYDRPSPYDYKYRPDYTINVLNSLILSFIINNWDHVLIIYAKRTVAFLGRWVWQTDLQSVNGIIKFAKQSLPTALFMTGTIAAIVNRLFRKASVVWLTIFAVFVFCIIFFIDGLYRYRAPAMPFMIIVAAYGADRGIRLVWIVAKIMMGKLSRYGRRKSTDCSSGIQ
ncbi:glycosyltransferase family 39 protein [Paenibacillus allorhizosphaerae]|nr:glycosyltransferase family 39 protein [Paenibacillus allorhizosphaerae]